MAVLMEYYNVIIKNDTIKNKYPGGIKSYIKDVPNITFCTDNKITRVGFMDGEFLDNYVKNLENIGFITKNNKDICITRMSIGNIGECDWLICGRIEGMGYDFTALKSEEVSPDTIILPEGINKDYVTDTPLYDYKFGYSGTIDGYCYVDGEQIYNLKGDEQIAPKEYLEEYCKPLKYDKKTYKHIIGPYSKDKNNVYLLENIIEGANPESFKILSLLQLISKDNNNIFYVNIKIHDVDINTFELKGGCFSINSNYLVNYFLRTKESLNNRILKFGSFNMDNAYYYYDNDHNIHIETYKGKQYLLFAGNESYFEEGVYYYPNNNTFIRYKT